ARGAHARARGAGRREAVRNAGIARAVRRRGRSGQEGVPVAAEGRRTQAHRQRRRPDRRAWPVRHPAARGRGRRDLHRTRFRPVPTGRDPGAERGHAGHAALGADPRHDRRRRAQALHAPLQLPAVLDRRNAHRPYSTPPPFSTGEVGRVGSPKRREIGHGALAERALVPVLPSAEEWPYTMRVVSEVLSSNGSTSMASVCGSTLSLMDAGVPVKAPVAGIAMGLVYADGKYTTLTDILGAEDAFGDMDFKVAGTEDSVTALQLDTKIDGLPADVLAEALRQAKDARLKILGVLHGAIPEPRSDVRERAPKIVSFEIPLDKIGEVIGPKGKVINAITLETGADISVNDDGVVGTVTIGSKDGSQVEEARRRIDLI